MEITIWDPGVVVASKILLKANRPMTRPAIMQVLKSHDLPEYQKTTLRKRLESAMSRIKNGDNDKVVRIMSYDCYEVFFGLIIWKEEDFINDLRTD